MKVIKIPGLGRFGVFIDDVDLNHISNEEWIDILKKATDGMEVVS
jgi:hypothetical protein